MSQDKFIDEFVIKFPRLYIRSLSYHFPFTENDILKYGFLLSWDKLGLLGNSNIIWTKRLKETYKARLVGKKFGPNFQEYIPHADNYLINDWNSVIKLRPYVKNDLNEIKLVDLNIELVTKYKNRITDWRTISANFNFASNENLFIDKINRIALLVNPFTDWDNTFLYQFYNDTYPAFTCENIWFKFISKNVNSLNINIHLESFNRLAKFIKINWRLDEPLKDGRFKHLMGVYVKSEYGNQLMSSGYYFSKRHFELGEIIELSIDHKFPISNQLTYS